MNLTNEAAPEGDEELEDEFGGRAAGVEAGVLLEEAGGGAVEAGVGAIQPSLQGVLLHLIIIIIIIILIIIIIIITRRIIMASSR